VWAWVLFLCLSAGLLIIGRQPATAQPRQGYQLTDDRIVVETASHWHNWSVPTHAVDITPEGRVLPHWFRQRYNLLDDRETFARRLSELKRKKTETAILNIDSVETLDVRGNVITQKKGGQEVPVYTYRVRMGISRVGSNPEAAAHILDGDPSTYWEPDPDDSLDAWWIEVDLGRVVVVDSLVLRFVEAEVGEPFRQFRVLVAANQVPVLENDKKLDFSLVGWTTAPNRDQRLFSFGLDQFGSSPEWTGRMVETIRLVVSDTKGGQGHRISEAEWDALDPSDRGDIVYFIRDEEGFEEPVDRDIYEGLPPERRGRREYYRRERPRLADIEVWGYGDNMSPGILAGGGNLFLTGGGLSAGPGFDGDFSTHFLHAVREKTAIVDRGVLTVDMGATFWLDGVRTSSTRPRTYIDGYKMLGSDGTLDTSGQLKWRRLSPLARENNRVNLFQHLLEIFDPPTRLRFLEITITNPNAGNLCMHCAGPNIAEYQLFSQGYPAEVVLHSDLISLPAGRNLGRIHWQADTPPGTTLEIRTRSGDLRRKVIRYFDKSGSEITQKQWNNLLGSFKGPVDTAFVVGSDWSHWSRSYQQSGDPVTSPSQKSFLQLQVTLRTEDRWRAASIDAIEVELLEPVAERLLGELWPSAVTVPGRLDTFEVFVQPLFVERPTRVRSAGFDEVRLTLSGGSRLELLDVAVDVDASRGQAAQTFRPSAEGSFTDADGQELELLRNQADSLWFRLPDGIHALSPEQGQRIYHRIASEEDQVPVTRDGQVLTAASYGLLEIEERGDRRYFRQDLDAEGQLRLTPVDEATYDGLDEDARQVRYFRILQDEGGQFPFDAGGDSLDQEGYNRLPSSARGRIVGWGPLLRMRFAAPIFVNGTVLEMGVRHTAGGTDPAAPWQRIEPGDATGRVGGDGLSIQVPLEVSPLDDFRIVPDPFTPNGDGINDATQICFSVFNVTVGRQATVRIYRLDGRRVWEDRQRVDSGGVTVVWSGTDAQGARVPPGIYLCQISLDIDAEEETGSTTRTRLLHVAY